MGAWVLDVAFFVILFLGTLIGAIRGFIKGICKIAGTIFAAFVAFSFCISFSNALERWFGLQTALSGAVGNVFASILSIVISFIALFIIVKLLAWALGKFGTFIVKKSKGAMAINRFLGALLGMFKSLLVIFVLLAICYWLPLGALHDYINHSVVVGAIFNWDLFINIAHLKLW